MDEQLLLPAELHVDGILLPEFAEFLASVGALAAREAVLGRSFHIGLLLPSEEFAAVFVALGAVVARSRLEPVSEGSDAAQHFKRLKDLPPGSRVWLLDNGCKYKAFLEGSIVGHDGVERIRVRRESLANGGLTLSLPAARALDVLPAENAEWDELPLHAGGIALKGSPQLIRSIFGGEVNAVLTSPRSDAIIVGRKATVVDELDVKITTEAGEGRLAELVRLDAGHASTYRARWLSARSDRLDELAGHGHRPVIILNGASNHLNAFFRVQGSVSVSIIGAAEPQAVEAVDDLQAAMFLGTHEPAPLPADLSVPDGVSTFAMRGDA